MFNLMEIHVLFYFYTTAMPTVDRNPVQDTLAMPTVVNNQISLGLVNYMYTFQFKHNSSGFVSAPYRFASSLFFEQL